MQYMLLLYREGPAAPGEEGAESARDMGTAEFSAFSDEVKTRGIHRGGEALHPSATATTVRIRHGKTVTTDGPVAEPTAELSGFYLVECPNLDEALDCAAKIPWARFGAVEIRPVREGGPQSPPGYEVENVT